MDKKSKVDKKLDKKVKKEIKKINKPKKLVPQKKGSNEPFLEDIETIKTEKKKKSAQKLELIVIVFFSIVMLVLLCNRTFFRRNYKTSKINIDIPLLMFFKKDDGNKLVLKTLRKSEYVKDYFENELIDKFKRIECNNRTIYYDENNHYAIFGVKIEKDFVVKTVTITYASGEGNCLCSSGLVGKEAEDYCK